MDCPPRPRVEVPGSSRESGVLFSPGRGGTPQALGLRALFISFSHSTWPDATGRGHTVPRTRRPTTALPPVRVVRCRTQRWRDTRPGRERTRVGRRKNQKMPANPGFAEYRSPWATSDAALAAWCRLFHVRPGRTVHSFPCNDATVTFFEFFYMEARSPNDKSKTNDP